MADTTVAEVTPAEDNNADETTAEVSVDVPADGVNKPLVVVYATTTCPHCKRAKKLLKDKEVGFWEINLDKNPDLRSEMITITSRTSVPQVFVQGRHVGGADDTVAAEEEGRLDALLAEELDLPDVAPTHVRGVWREKGIIVDPVPEAEPVMPNSPTLSECTLDLLDYDSLVAAIRAGAVTVKNVSYDQLEVIATKARADPAVGVGPHVYHLVTYNDCFVASEFLDWFVEEFGVTRPHALDFGSRMFEARLFSHVVNKEPFKDGNFFFRFQPDCEHVALNMDKVWLGPARDAEIVGAELRGHIDVLLSQFLSDDGHHIDTAGLRESEGFAEFRKAAAELQRVELGGMNDEQLLAFFINLYNMLVIHGKAVYGHPATAYARSGFYSNTRYNVGGYLYSLDDIEHGVLRCNAKPPGVFSSRKFSANDPRMAAMLTEFTPLIHFALNCGASSCPAIRIYDPGNVRDGLKWAAQAFFESEENLGIDVTSRTVTTSKILSWYGGDFGANAREIVRFISDYAPAEKADQLAVILETAGNPTLRFSPYDWSE